MSKEPSRLGRWANPKPKKPWIPYSWGRFFLMAFLSPAFALAVPPYFFYGFKVGASSLFLVFGSIPGYFSLLLALPFLIWCRAEKKSNIILYLISGALIGACGVLVFSVLIELVSTRPYKVDGPMTRIMPWGGIGAAFGFASALFFWFMEVRHNPHYMKSVDEADGSSSM